MVGFDTIVLWVLIHRFLDCRCCCVGFCKGLVCGVAQLVMLLVGLVVLL